MRKSQKTSQIVVLRRVLSYQRFHCSSKSGQSRRELTWWLWTRFGGQLDVINGNVSGRAIADSCRKHQLKMLQVLHQL